MLYQLLQPLEVVNHVEQKLAGISLFPAVIAAGKVLRHHSGGLYLGAECISPAPDSYLETLIDQGHLQQISGVVQYRVKKPFDVGNPRTFEHPYQIRPGQLVEVRWLESGDNALGELWWVEDEPPAFLTAVGSAFVHQLEEGGFLEEIRVPSSIAEEVIRRSPIVADRSVSICRILLPRDTNHRGEVFGGVLLSEIDLAGSVEARKWTKHDVATRAIKEVEFFHPVAVGDVVTFWTSLIRVGRTSVTVRVEVETGRDGESPLVVAEASVVYVAVARGEDGGLRSVEVDS